MKKSELIHTVETIFSKSKHPFEIDRKNLLEQTGSQYYSIQAYQRGYKWTKEMVESLITDFIKGFELHQDHYLQHITIQTVKDENGYFFLELIDGQQRLTTLSLLLSELRYRNQKAPDPQIIEYKIRPDTYMFLKEKIWNRTPLGNNEAVLFEIDESSQDKFYLTQAIRTIQDELTKIDEINKINLEDFTKYILEKAKIIVNHLDSHITPEYIYSRMNGVKVQLKDAELIKAFILTNAVREENTSSFQEINEKRIFMAEKWDEMFDFFIQINVNKLFFNNQSEIPEGRFENFLTLYLSKCGLKPAENKTFPIFSVFENNIILSDNTPAKKSKIFTELLELYNVISKWYHDPEVHNWLALSKLSKIEPGIDYFFNAQSNSYKVKKEVLRTIKNNLLNKLPKPDLELNYPNGLIKTVLIARNLFGSTGNTFNKINFSDWDETKTGNVWSLEHILPQSFDDLEIEETDQKQFLNPDTMNDFIHLIVGLGEADFTEDLKTLDNEIQFRDFVINALKSDIDKKSDFLTEKTPISENIREFITDCYKKLSADMNSLGNMTLLRKFDNSALGKKPFSAKRKVVNLWVKDSHPIPAHTFDVFSKLILKEPGELQIWSLANIKEHKTTLTTWYKDWYNNLIKSLN